MNLEDTLKRIKKHEGFVTEVYKDPLGNDTVGYGFTIRDLRLPEGVSSTILRILVLDLTLRLHDRFVWFRSMPGVVQSVVVEMCYQLGVRGFSRFKKTIAHLKMKRWREASEEMLDSRWARQTPERARELSRIIASTE